MNGKTRQNSEPNRRAEFVRTFFPLARRRNRAFRNAISRNIIILSLAFPSQ
jgi:hypothetical protein